MEECGVMMSRKLMCVGGPHNGKIIDVEFMCDRVTCVREAEPVMATYEPNFFPSVDNMKKLFDTMVRKTVYVVVDGPRGSYLKPE
jgi:hypothetical protein